MYIHKLYLNQFNILLTRGINTLICFAPHGGCKPPFSSTRGLKNPLFAPPNLWKRLVQIRCGGLTGVYPREKWILLHFSQKRFCSTFPKSDFAPLFPKVDLFKLIFNHSFDIRFQPRINDIFESR